MKTKRDFPSGFTLVEMLMAMIVALIVTAAIWTAVVSGQRSSVGIERKVTTNQDTRAALDIMATEIRMASYNPAFADTSTNLWVNGGNCTFGTQANRGIPEATATAITVEMDIRGPCPPSVDPNGSCPDGAIRAGSGNEIIRYELDAANFRITRETIVCNGGTRTSSGAQPLLGPIDGRPDVRTVRVINGAVPLFRYFDRESNEIPVANLPARIPEIRRIEIALIVESADNDPNTGQPRRMAYSTSVIPRNHGIIF